MSWGAKATEHMEIAARFAKRAADNSSNIDTVRKYAEVARINLQIADAYVRQGL